jgi:hypothetical protein
VTDLYNKNAALQVLLKSLQDQNNRTQLAVAAQSNGTGDLSALSNIYNALQLNMSVSVKAQQVANDNFRAALVVSNDAMQSAIHDMDQAYGDMMATIRDLDLNPGISNTGLSPAAFGLLIAGTVFGLLGFLLGSAPYVEKYGPGVYRWFNDKRPKSGEDDEDGEEQVEGDTESPEPEEAEEEEQEAAPSARVQIGREELYKQAQTSYLPVFRGPAPRTS